MPPVLPSDAETTAYEMVVSVMPSASVTLTVNVTLIEGSSALDAVISAMPSPFALRRALFEPSIGETSTTEESPVFQRTVTGAS